MNDFHTHILPEIDDGSNSAKESVVLLRKLKEQGVENVLLTPHFYAYSSSAESYREKQSKSLRLLLDELNKDRVDINLYMGCEVYYFEELWRIDDLSRLCIKGTDYILIEMPFSEWTDSMIGCVEKILGKGYTPILAHFERYLRYKGNMAKIRQMLHMGVLLQMNCSYINSWITGRKAVRYIRSGMVALLGTDCHNLSDRAPDYDKAFAKLQKKLKRIEYRRLLHIQKDILSSAEKVYPE